MTPLHVTRSVRIAGAAGGIAALCIGFAVPASAHGNDGTSSPSPSSASSGGASDHQLTLAQQKQVAQAVLAEHLARINACAAKVADDADLTDAQQAAYADAVAKERDAITTAQNAVAAASTPDQLRAAFVTLWQQSTPDLPVDHHFAHHDFAKHDSQHHQSPTSVQLTAAKKSTTHTVDPAVAGHGPCDHSSDGINAAAFTDDNDGWHHDADHDGFGDHHGFGDDHGWSHDGDSHGFGGHHGWSHDSGFSRH